MKKLFIILVSVLCFCSCESHTERVEAKETRFSITTYGTYYRVIKDLETGNEYLVVYSSYGIAVTKM